MPLTRLPRHTLLCIALLGSAMAGAWAQQPAPPVLKKVAIVSLIGDEIAVDQYRQRVGTRIDFNEREVSPFNNPLYDHAALLAAAGTASKRFAGAQFLPLAVPKAGTALDPNTFATESGFTMSGAVLDALGQQGFDHLIAIAKLRAPARMQLFGLNVGAGHVRGLGFYVDQYLATQQLETGEQGQGFIAPYAYVSLTLVDVKAGAVVRTVPVTGSAAQSSARSRDGAGAWGALTAPEKVNLLRAVVQHHVAEGTLRLLE